MSTIGALPTVSGISPAGGTVAGGTTVTISGNNFLTGASVSFGHALADECFGKCFWKCDYSHCANWFGHSRCHSHDAQRDEFHFISRQVHVFVKMTGRAMRFGQLVETLIGWSSL